jgi:hypothetical protein
MFTRSNHPEHEYSRELLFRPVLQSIHGPKTSVQHSFASSLRMFCTRQAYPPGYGVFLCCGEIVWEDASRSVARAGLPCICWTKAAVAIARPALRTAAPQRSSRVRLSPSRLSSTRTASVRSRASGKSQQRCPSSDLPSQS